MSISFHLSFLRIGVILLFFGGCLSSLQAQVNRAQFRLPDTWETQSYTNTFGEDHDYTRFKPALSNVNDSVVYDSVTTLIWMKYDGGEMTVDSAIRYCQNLKLKGYSQWRLPNPYEAFSILNQQVTNPAVPVAFFPKTGAEYWWTSEKQINDNKKWWCTNAGGGIGNHPISETISAGGTKKFHAKCVQSSNVYSVTQRYVTVSDSLITDSFTGLQWYLIPLGSALTWENALSACENATLGGHSDWRLPNIKELQSIHSTVNVQPSQQALFKYPVGHYWSSTSLPNQTTKAWYWENGFGITTYELKTNSMYVAAVRTLTNSVSSVIKMQAIDIQWTPIPSLAFPQMVIHKGNSATVIPLNHEALKILNVIDVHGKNYSVNSTLSPGIYWIKGSFEGHFFTSKIIIE